MEQRCIISKKLYTTFHTRGQVINISHSFLEDSAFLQNLLRFIATILSRDRSIQASKPKSRLFGTQEYRDLELCHLGIKDQLYSSKVILTHKPFFTTTDAVYILQPEIDHHNVKFRHPFTKD